MPSAQACTSWVLAQLAARVTAAARLARREAEASFIKCTRVSDKILTALVSREVLATQLPRSRRTPSAQG